MIPDNLCSRYKETVYPITDFADNITKYVYLLHNPLSNLSKIGITNNPRLRKMQLQNASGMELNTLLVIELEADYDETPRTIEVFLHSFYKHKRTFGEWFNLSTEDFINIQTLFWEVIEGASIEDYLNTYFPSH